MEFSILSKELLKRDKIKNIVKKVEAYELIFTFDQMKYFDYFCPIDTRLILKEYDSLKQEGFMYKLSQNLTEKIDVYKYYHVLPIVKFEEIKESSQIISETDDTIKIQNGRYLTSRVSTDEELQKIKMSSVLGNIVDTNRKITICIDKDGKKTKLRVYQDNQTGEEYVFMKKKEDGTFDDSLDFQTTFIGIVSPLTWTVDKSTGLAICTNPLFFSEKFKGEYDKSALANFLKSDEFIEELGMSSKKKKDLNVTSRNPFGQKKDRLSLEEKIKRILMSGNRIPYLVGHPGIGKTQIAKSINKNCLSFNIATFTPDDFTGKTSIVPGDKIITQDGDKTIEHSEKGRTATAEPEWHTKLVDMSNQCRRTNERCILLLDEFDKLTPNM